MRTFFFKHPLVSKPYFDGFIPGRYRYDVKGKCLTSDARNYRLEAFNGRIYGDAHDDNTPGSNVDPNVLSAVLPWFLSYCRISNREKTNNLARPAMALLSEVVRGGDVVIFGGDEDDRGKLGRDVVFVDTILCVNQDPRFQRVDIPRNPEKPDELDVYLYCCRHWSDLKLPSWGEFQKTADFKYNLNAAMPGGTHHRTRVGRGHPHLQIIGTRLQTQKFTECSSDTVLERFCCGAGFNACPLLPPDTDYTSMTASSQIASRPGLFVTMVAGISAAVSHHNVVELDTVLARSLLAAVISQSERLVLDPVIPTGLAKSDTARRGH